jgi:DNA-binding FadR family transcriptional regulator
MSAREQFAELPVAGLREPRLHERVAVALACDVVNGTLAPGDHFPSAEEIVERFGVSRTVARETVQTLSMIGMVRVHHGKRSDVRPSDDWNVLTPVVQEALRREDRLQPLWHDLYDFRLLIEPPAASWMAERGSDRELAQLSALAAEMRVLTEDIANSSRVLAADQAFHRLIAQASSNLVLAAVSRSFWEALSVVWLESHLGAQELRDVAEQHSLIADAVVRRDPEAAASAMEEHLNAASTMDVGHFPQEQ